jgi:hypothetical protein
MMQNLPYGLAIMTWIPNAALFAHATQATAISLYKTLPQAWQHCKNQHLSDWLFFIATLCSGSSYGQITMDFLNPNTPIPMLFKADWVQMSLPLVVPIAVLSSAMVNYCAIKGIDYKKMPWKNRQPQS